jgi:hypothetical protein
MITSDLLKEHGLDEEEIRWFEENFPNGIDLDTFLAAADGLAEMYYLIYEHFSLSTEQYELYKKALNLVDSTGVYMSKNVVNSDIVISSTNVSDSKTVFHSEDVEDSQVVVASESVEHSHQVFLSTFVYDSKKICSSNNITNSSNIIESVYVINSNNIYMSNIVSNCSEIHRCANIKNSYFCKDSKNLNNCMFCAGLSDAEYHIFNKPVDPDRYEMIKKQYLNIVDGISLNYVDEWPIEFVSATVPRVNRKFTNHYDTLPPKLWKWLKTLPDYSKEIMFYLTSLPEFLTK